MADEKEGAAGPAPGSADYVQAQIAALDAKMRGVLVATMAATMLPGIMGLYTPTEGGGPLTEDEAVDMAFRLAAKLSKRLAREIG